MKTRLIHFGRFDARCCGKAGTRRFTTDESEVTCPVCKAQDRAWLTPQGAEAVRAIEEGRLEEYIADFLAKAREGGGQ